jgi:hypothetical protein
MQSAAAASRTKAQFRTKFDRSIGERIRLPRTIAKKSVRSPDDAPVLPYCAGLTLLITERCWIHKYRFCSQPERSAELSGLSGARARVRARGEDRPSSNFNWNFPYVGDLLCIVSSYINQESRGSRQRCRCRQQRYRGKDAAHQRTNDRYFRRCERDSEATDVAHPLNVRRFFQTAYKYRSKEQSICILLQESITECQRDSFWILRICWILLHLLACSPCAPLYVYFFSVLTSPTQLKLKIWSSSLPPKKEKRNEWRCRFRVKICACAFFPLYIRVCVYIRVVTVAVTVQDFWKKRERKKESFPLCLFSFLC